uniref:Ubiquitin carboxyl-terminal hydrolase 25 n=1 Tax=Hemiscolopendra marginata TaxID=943146 RepID=A0A646QD05_9MYRI
MSTMTVEQSHIEHIHTQQQTLLDQLKEITGVEDENVLEHALQASRTEGGKYDLSQAVTILVDENAIRYNQQSSPVQNPPAQQQTQANEPAKTKATKEAGGVIDLTNEGSEKEELQRAIALSLQEQQHGMLGGQVTAEEQDISRVLEQSLAEAKAGTKRKRGEVWQDPLNPHERKRQNDWPVGLKNVGNTCWFSAVIQSLFHLPVFRYLVLNFVPPELNCDVSVAYSAEHRNLVFMQELRRLFALMVASHRKYVDPLKAVEILKEAFQPGSSDSQQDVSEFTHKLLEWLEDAFKSDCSISSSGDTSHNCAWKDKNPNPMLDLFYGQFRSEGNNEGHRFSNEETFGQYPLQVNSFSNIHESLEAATAQEIETSNQETVTKSGQEHWFTKLPPVLLFELSRFQFNQQLGRPEKIHNKFEFPEIIYMDRYMEVNKNITQTKREEVRKLKNRRDDLQNRLEKYLNYGSGSKRVPLQDVLQYALEFVESKQDSDSCLNQDIDMASPISNSSMSADSPHGSPAKNILPDVAVESHGGKSTVLSGEKPLPSSNPSPQHVSKVELGVLQNCLKRWRTEVANDVRELQDNISVIDGTINNTYNESSLQKVPYRLHAVLVHEGQAASGHYWAYVYNHIAKLWLKFNDITVCETTWDELQRESVGGYHNTSAYCLMYIDCNKKELVDNSSDNELGRRISGLEGLPNDLRQLIIEDNRRFQKEMDQWDQDQLHKKEEAAKLDIECQILDERKTCGQGKGFGSKLPLAVELSQIPYTAAIQAISRVPDMNTKSPEGIFKEAMVYELNRIKHLSSIPTTTSDHRLEHILIYILKNNDPPDILVRLFLAEEFAYLKHDNDKGIIAAVCQAADQHVKNIKTNAKFQDLEKLYHRFLECFATFWKITTYFIVGFEIFQKEKYQESLPYFITACAQNDMLYKKSGKPNCGLDPKLLAEYRRRCLLNVNDIALFQFDSDDIEIALDSLQINSNLITPCMNFLNASDASQEDNVAAEEIRSKWCSKLGDEISGEKQKHLQEFLAKLLDPSGETNFCVPPPTRINFCNDLAHKLSKLVSEAHKAGFRKLPLSSR